MEKRPATAVKSAPSTQSTQVPLKVSTVVVTTKAAQQSNEPQVVTPKSENPNDASLLSFLKNQAACLKGSPQEFHHFLVNSQDIKTLNGLAISVSDADYFRNVIQPGNGTVSIKGFKRSAFTKAVLVASMTSFYNNGNDNEDDKENATPASVSNLTCPISRVLMTTDPVIAADGHTYERSAIEAYFQKQNAEIAAARVELSKTNSKMAQATIVRGVLSPVTKKKMIHLNLAATMAQNAAAPVSKQENVLGECTSN